MVQMISGARYSPPAATLSSSRPGPNFRSPQTEFYHNSSAIVNGQIVYSLFSTTDPAEHARIKRPVAKYFALGNVLALEPHIDKAIADLCDHLERRFSNGPEKGKSCDLGEWIAYCLSPPFLRVLSSSHIEQ